MPSVCPRCCSVNTNYVSGTNLDGDVIVSCDVCPMKASFSANPKLPKEWYRDKCVEKVVRSEHRRRS